MKNPKVVAFVIATICLIALQPFPSSSFLKVGIAFLVYACLRNKQIFKKG